MYDETLKGLWVERPGSKVHMVVNVTAGRLESDCGRRLTAPGWVKAAPTINRLGVICKQCAP